jgi:hypothetical protein
MAYDKPFELKPGNFQLFKNTKKADVKHADWTGSIKLPDGREYWFNMYNKEGSKGAYFSGYIGKEKQQLDQPGSFNSFAPSAPIGRPENYAPAAPLDDVPF